MWSINIKNKTLWAKEFHIIIYDNIYILILLSGQILRQALLEKTKKNLLTG